MSRSSPPPVPPDGRAVNRLAIQIATVNGSGSQTANNVLLRSLFHMGLPVSGKNLFPSNIQGLPTWFTIRVDEDGHVARRREVDLLVAMNPASAEKDVRSLPAGASAVYDRTLGLERTRSGDVTLYPVPFQDLVREVCEPVALRKLVVNMIYVGVVAHLLDIDLAEVDRALDQAFGKKPKALNLNRDAVKAGVAWAKAHADARPAVRVERRDLTKGKILVDGNTATAVGALMAGVTVVAWYPITPSSGVAEALLEQGEAWRRDPATGKTTLAVLQAEDELAAVGMAIGAGWAGARSMTATSGPGISLMSEFVGLAYFAEVPTVIVDVQRVGPSTGLPTRTQQSDVLKTAFLSHGDARHPCLYPADVQEAYRFTHDAFDLAEGLQTPVFVLTDLDLGMNLSMSDPFPYPVLPMNRGKVLDAEGLRAVEGWGRYKDVDGDGVPYRSLPGTPGGAGAYFTRGSGHDEMARYSEDAETYVRVMERLARKLETVRRLLPAPVLDGSGARVGILSYGTSAAAVEEAREALRREDGLATDALRVRAWPFADGVREWLLAHERVYVVEQNRDAQMLRMLRMDVPEAATRLVPVLHYGGLPLDAASVVAAVRAAEGAERDANGAGRDANGAGRDANGAERDAEGAERAPPAAKGGAR